MAAAHLLGIDIGGTKCALALARGELDVVAETRLEDWASDSPERDLERLVTESRGLLANARIEASDVRAVGVSAPGPLDPRTGVLIRAPNLPSWRNVPLVAALERGLGIPVRLENDANAAALAEWRFGAGRGVRDLCFVTMSTGVGGGWILDGKLYRGASFEAGEVGHMPVVPDGRLCACGMRGCLEAYTGGRALADRMREDAAHGEADAILELAGGDPARISARVWVKAVRARDPYALRLREEFLERLAQGLAILVFALNPARIVLGTIVRENADLFLDDLRSRVRARVWPTLASVEIEPGALGVRLPVYAALAVAALAP